MYCYLTAQQHSGTLIANETVSVADSIENNIENVHGNVELGQQQLQKAAEYQVNASWRDCKLMCLLI
jgi:t-SNARE complex subunit (syntaxin)